MTPLDIMARPARMSLWLSHRTEFRPVGDIVSEARSGKLHGVAELGSGHGFRDEAAALAAMRKVVTAILVARDGTAH